MFGRNVKARPRRRGRALLGTRVTTSDAVEASSIHAVLRAFFFLPHFNHPTISNRASSYVSFASSNRVYERVQQVQVTRAGRKLQPTSSFPLSSGGVEVNFSKLSFQLLLSYDRVSPSLSVHHMISFRDSQSPLTALLVPINSPGRGYNALKWCIRT